MTVLVTELKVRARLQVNAARRGQDGGGLRLGDCLHQVARDAGFLHWEHARRVLGGLAAAGDDMGTFWHAPATGVLLNQWFARYDQALAVLRTDPAAYLLPYRRQFMLVQNDFVRELGVDPHDGNWASVGHDLAGGYGSAAWLTLARQRIAAPRASFAAG